MKYKNFSVTLRIRKTPPGSIGTLSPSGETPLTPIPRIIFPILLSLVRPTLTVATLILIYSIFPGRISVGYKYSTSKS